MNLNHLERSLYHAKASHVYTSRNPIINNDGTNSTVTNAQAPTNQTTNHNNSTPTKDRASEKWDGPDNVNVNDGEASRQEPPSTAESALRWKDLQGLNHWKGLLEPLDFDLRKSILRYGELAQACYNSFDTDEHSRYTGTCKFSKDEFFDKAGLVKGKDTPPFGYKVVRYLYACCSIDMPHLAMMYSRSREPWSKQSNWIGYVAVSTDEATNTWLGRRDIVVVWRGTIRPLEWIHDFDFRQADITPLLPRSSIPSRFFKNEDDQPQVVRGWLALYTSRDPQSGFTTNSARDQVPCDV